MKAILINSKTRQITETEINDWSEISPSIDARIFDCVRIGDTDILYVDDEGLLSLDNDSMFIRVTVDGESVTLAGNGLILGSDDEGQSTDTALTVEQVKEMVEFKPLAEVSMSEVG